MTVQRSKQFLVQGCMNYLKKKNMKTALLSRRVLSTRRLYIIHVGGSRAVNKIHRVIKNSSRDSSRTHVHKRTHRTQRASMRRIMIVSGLFISDIFGISRLSDAEEPRD